MANSAVLHEDDKEVIHDLANYILKASRYETVSGLYKFKVFVEGHADTGRRNAKGEEPRDKDGNPPLQSLCQARAEAVRDELLRPIHGENRDEAIPKEVSIECLGVGATGLSPTGGKVEKNYNKRVYFRCEAERKPERQEPEPLTLEPVPVPVEPAEHKRLREENAWLQNADRDSRTTISRLQKADVKSKTIISQHQNRERELLTRIDTLIREQDHPPNDGCCTLIPKAGTSMDVLHGVTELAWIAAMLLCGKAVFAALLTRASLETADTCPEVEVRLSHSPADPCSSLSTDRRCY